MRHIRRFLVAGALTGGLALAGASGAAGSATAVPAQSSTTGVTASPDGALAWSCGGWGEVLPPAVWGRSCRNSVPAQGAGEAFNGRSYDVRLRITVKSRTPWGDLNLGSCDKWVAPGTYFRCGDFTLGAAISQYPVVAFVQQLQP